MAEAEERQRVLRALNRALSVLSARERRVIDARLMTEQAQTLDELGGELRISSERVRQIGGRAPQKIKAAVRAEIEGRRRSARSRA
ncbi:hypothetical protein FXB40_11250 [Bradyrhizobium rifense]|uniref:RNA polymerase sigma-70 region 4 domain-containing protein n=1 Tax=Bradyrhizobium rifense TaxID=515499 RepID=A0A5D3KP95_9BRAD|nr:hypothetical protein FXB40_11250 [Bradyrhizobium rifense]